MAASSLCRKNTRNAKTEWANEIEIWRESISISSKHTTHNSYVPTNQPTTQPTHQHTHINEHKLKVVSYAIINCFQLLNAIWWRKMCIGLVLCVRIPKWKRYYCCYHRHRICAQCFQHRISSVNTLRIHAHCTYHQVIIINVIYLTSLNFADSLSCFKSTRPMAIEFDVKICAKISATLNVMEFHQMVYSAVQCS